MMVKFAPHLGYQLYFADPRSDTEILNQVRHQILLYYLIQKLFFFFWQLKNFLTLAFTFDHTVSLVGAFEAKLSEPDKAQILLTDRVSHI